MFLWNNNHRLCLECVYLLCDCNHMKLKVICIVKIFIIQLYISQNNSLINDNLRTHTIYIYIYIYIKHPLHSFRNNSGNSPIKKKK